MTIAIMHEANFYPLDDDDNIIVDCDYITITLRVPKDFEVFAGNYLITKEK